MDEDSSVSIADLADSERSLGTALQNDPRAAQARIERWALDWLERFRLKTIVLTCGANGAFLIDQNGSEYVPSQKIEVKDAVGAGDAFAAVCVVGLVSGRSKANTLRAASQRAAFVCRQDGGTPVVPIEEQDPFNQ